MMESDIEIPVASLSDGVRSRLEGQQIKLTTSTIRTTLVLHAIQTREQGHRRPFCNMSDMVIIRKALGKTVMHL